MTTPLAVQQSDSIQSVGQYWSSLPTLSARARAFALRLGAHVPDQSGQATLGTARAESHLCGRFRAPSSDPQETRVARSGCLTFRKQTRASEHPVKRPDYYRILRQQPIIDLQCGSFSLGIHREIRRRDLRIFLEIDADVLVLEAEFFQRIHRYVRASRRKMEKGEIQVGLPDYVRRFAIAGVAAVGS